MRHVLLPSSLGLTWTPPRCPVRFLWRGEFLFGFRRSVDPWFVLSRVSSRVVSRPPSWFRWLGFLGLHIRHVLVQLRASPSLLPAIASSSSEATSNVSSANLYSFCQTSWCGLLCSLLITYSVRFLFSLLPLCYFSPSIPGTDVLLLLLLDFQIQVFWAICCWWELLYCLGPFAASLILDFSSFFTSWPIVLSGGFKSVVRVIAGGTRR